MVFMKTMQRFQLINAVHEKDVTTYFYLLRLCFIHMCFIIFALFRFCAVAAAFFFLID